MSGSGRLLGGRPSTEELEQKRAEKIAELEQQFQQARDEYQDFILEFERITSTGAIPTGSPVRRAIIEGQNRAEAKMNRLHVQLEALIKNEDLETIAPSPAAQSPARDPSRIPETPSDLLSVHSPTHQERETIQSLLKDIEEGGNDPRPASERVESLQREIGRLPASPDPNPIKPKNESSSSGEVPRLSTPELAQPSPPSSEDEELAKKLAKIFKPSESKLKIMKWEIPSVTITKLKTGMDALAYNRWVNAITPSLASYNGLMEILTTSPASSWPVFKQIYSPIINENRLEDEYLRAHLAIYNFIMSNIDESLINLLSIRIRDEYKVQRTFNNLNFRHVAAEYYFDANLLGILINKNFTFNDQLSLGSVTNKIALHPAKFHDYSKNPAEWVDHYVELNDLLMLKGGHKPTDSEMANMLSILIPDKELREAISLRRDINPKWELEDLRNFLIKRMQQREFNREIKPREEKPKTTPKDKSKDKSKEKSKDKIGNVKGQDKRALCYNYASTGKCRFGDKCLYRHEYNPEKTKHNNQFKPNTNKANNNDEKDGNPGTKFVFCINEFNCRDTDDEDDVSEPERDFQVGDTMVLAENPPAGFVIGPEDFILDSGTLNHYTGSLQLLEKGTTGVIKQDPIIIQTIAGRAKIRQRGNVKLKDNVELRNVRYVPNSPSSLMSLFQIVKTGKYSVVFNSECARVVLSHNLNECEGKWDRDIPERIYFHCVNGMYIMPALDKVVSSQGFHRIPPPPPEVKEERPARQRIPRKGERKQPEESKADGGQPPQVAANVRFGKNRYYKREESHFIAEYDYTKLVFQGQDVDGYESSSESDDVFDSSNDVEWQEAIMNLHINSNHLDMNAFKQLTKAMGCSYREHQFEWLRDHCMACISARTTRAAVGQKNILRARTADYFGECWHADLAGPFNGLEEDSKILTPTLHGELYALFIVDEFSGYGFVALLKLKSEAVEVAMNYINFVQNRNYIKIKRFRCDGGSEFIKLAPFFEENGTELIKSLPNTPQYNGTVESYNRKVVGRQRASLIFAKAAPHLWGYSLTYMVHIDNRIPHSNKANSIPIKVADSSWKIIDYEKFHTFGVDVEVLLSEDKITKSSKRTQPGIFIGYSEEFNSHLVLIKHPQKGFVEKATRDVKFLTTFNNCDEWRDDIIDQAEHNITRADREYEVDTIYAERKFYGRTQYLVKWKGYKRPTWEPEEYLKNSPDIIRDFKKRNKLKDPFEGKSLNAFIYQVVYSVDENNNLTNFDYYIPKNYDEILKHPDREKFLAATDEEIGAVRRNKVFTEMLRPVGVNVLGSRFVYDVKRNEIGVIVRHKARWVVQGFGQKEGIDFFETFSPTSRFQCMKMLFALAAEHNWEIKQVDFDTAYLNAILGEDIYIRPPKGFEPESDIKGEIVLKLHKALYGLKQAAREWFKLIDSVLRGFGYKSIPHHPSVYVRVVAGGQRIFITLYVDDLVIFFPKGIESEWNNDLDKIALRFKIKDLGDCKWILNMAVHRDRDLGRITISQEQYVAKIISRFGFDDVNPSPTPFLFSDLSVVPEKIEPIVLSKSDMKLYQEIVGSLLYAANCTRADIAYVTSILARFMHQAYNYHLEAAERVLRYLKGTSSYTLVFQSDLDKRDDSMDVVIYADSDHAGEKNDRRSISGMVLEINGMVVHWESKKQGNVTLSSTEAELVSMTSAAKEAKHMINWFKFYFDRQIVVTMRCDNESSMKIADHPTNHQRTKHLDVDYFFIRELIERNLVDLRYINTKENLADLMTKALAKVLFRSLVSKILSMSVDQGGDDSDQEDLE